MTFSDYRFNVGVLVTTRNIGQEAVALELPESLGRFVTKVRDPEDLGAETVSYPSVNCSDAFVLDVDPVIRISNATIPYGLCADSKNTVVNGS